MAYLNGKRIFTVLPNGGLKDLGAFSSIDQLKLSLIDILASDLFTATLGVNKVFIIATISATGKYFTLNYLDKITYLTYVDAVWTIKEFDLNNIGG